MMSRLWNLYSPSDQLAQIMSVGSSTVVEPWRFQRVLLVG